MIPPTPGYVPGYIWGTKETDTQSITSGMINYRVTILVYHNYMYTSNS